MKGRRRATIGALCLCVVALSFFSLFRGIKIKRKLDVQHQLEQDSQDLMTWFKGNGGIAGHVHLQFFSGWDKQQGDLGSGLKDMVRGLGAREDMDKGELVLKVPRKLLIVPSKPVDSMQDNAILLALAVAAEIKKDSSSTWNRYLALLPSEKQLQRTHPMYASNSDLAIFSDIAMARAVRGTRSRLRDSWKKGKVDGDDGNIAASFEGVYEWSEMLRAYVVQLSRRIRLQLPSVSDKNSLSQTLALVPVMDMMNFGDETRKFNCGWDYAAEDDSLVVRTTRQVMRGEELLLSEEEVEGKPKDNAYMAYQYGITIDGNQTPLEQLPDDVCEGLQQEVEELKSERDKKHPYRVLLAKLARESCVEVFEKRMHEEERDKEDQDRIVFLAHVSN